MKTQQFLEHHGIRENPFGQEDAQSDHVFKQHCLSGTHHPSWDKIAGNPGEPSTSVVFGEKGSGKTALRLQIVRDVEEHNRTHPDRKVFIVEYDDFNPFLDSFRERLFGRKKNPERALRHWRLWDHMDAILSLAVTRLVRGILDANSQRADAVQINAEDLQKLDRNQKRDLLILAAYYDHSYDQPRYSRWNDLRKKVGFSTWLSDWDWYVGLLVTLLTIGVTGWYAWTEETVSLEIFGRWWFWLILVIGWLPWLFRQTGLLLKAWGVKRQIRVFDHLPNTLRKVLSRFSRTDIAGQPTPNKDRSDDRYEMILKLQGVLKRLGYANMLVLVD
nr:ATP-binding protein [Planctomycetota bacterium]